MRQSLLCATLASSVFVIAAGKALAQALPTATGPGASVSAGAGVAAFHVAYGDRTLGGAQGWIDANRFWWGGVEVEYRSLTHNEDLGAHASTLLAGPRVSLSARAVEPYVKLLAGRGRFCFPYGYAEGSYLALAAGSGVDLHLTRHLQWRALDLEYQKWPHFTYGGFDSYGVSSGISYTFIGGRRHFANNTRR